MDGIVIIGIVALRFRYIQFQFSICKSVNHTICDTQQYLAMLQRREIL